MRTVGELLRECRKDAKHIKITQKQIADILQKDISYISKVEKGGIEPNLSGTETEKLAQLFREKKISDAKIQEFIQTCESACITGGVTPVKDSDNLKFIYSTLQELDESEKQTYKKELYFSPEKSSEREREISFLLGKDILEGDSMRRLRGVSFLGVLNVSADVPEQQRFSRYEHSVSVAYLTWLFCKHLGINEEISLTATLAALIHDISHPPFSHSSEIYLQTKSGVETKHTSALTGQKIIKIVKESYSSFPRLLQKEGLYELASSVYKLLTSRKERGKYHPYIADIFDSPFCPDTFDGISRAWYALNTMEAKHRLATTKIKYLESINPTTLVRFISSTTPFPFVYRSSQPPSRANLIFRFHDLTRALYNNVIYSDWQSSAMVMFARALEIAYEDSGSFEFTHKNDANVLKMIEKKPTSHKLYELIVKRNSFYSLSKENPSLYKLSLDYYAETRKQHKSYRDTKRLIESIIASKLKVSDDSVFWHKYQPLIWSSDNIQFNEFGRNENYWSLKWNPSEGEPSKESEIEIYYTTSL